jgi:hypothetical protein
MEMKIFNCEHGTIGDEISAGGKGTYFFYLQFDIL